MVEKWTALAGYGRFGGTGREGAGWGKGSCQTPTLEGSGTMVSHGLRQPLADGPDPKGFALCRRPPIATAMILRNAAVLGWYFV